MRAHNKVNISSCTVIERWTFVFIFVESKLFNLLCMKFSLHIKEFIQMGLWVARVKYLIDYVDNKQVRYLG